MKKYVKPGLYVESLQHVNYIMTCTEDIADQPVITIVPDEWTYFGESGMYGCVYGIDKYNEDFPDDPICYHIPDDTFALHGS